MAAENENNLQNTMCCEDTMSQDWKADYVSTDAWKKEWSDIGGSGFHLQSINGILKKYLERMTAGRTGMSFLFPFCGKSVDMKWLADMGHTVIGVECSPKALEEFFIEQKVEYATETKDKFTIYKSKDGKLRMYCGDLYDYSSLCEGKFDIIWDRGGFNAVNKQEQTQYAELMIRLMKPDCQYYLLNFDMDDKIPENITKMEEMGFLTDDKLIGFFDDKCNLELRAEYVAADLYNGDLCKGEEMEGMIEKLTVISLKK